MRYGCRSTVRRVPSHHQIRSRALGIFFVGLEVDQLLAVSRELRCQLVFPLSSDFRTLEARYGGLEKLLKSTSEDVHSVAMPVLV